VFICHSDEGISVCCARLLRFFLRRNDKEDYSLTYDINRAQLGQGRKFTNLKYFDRISFFSKYRDYPTLDIVLEIGCYFGLLSVWYAKKRIFWFFNRIVYIDLCLFYCGNGLCGDMMINGYYFVMSIYGWYHWTRKKEIQLSFQFQNFQRRKTNCDNSFYIYVAFVVSVYHYFGKFTTCMLMYIYYRNFQECIHAKKRKVENWIF
jgi:nicotinamide mononucleotide transporter